MNVRFPFSLPDPQRVRDMLTENDFAPVFSAKQRAYYTFVRPLLPIAYRKKLQRTLLRSIEYKPNFIDDELVTMVRDALGDRFDSMPLYPDGARSCIVLTHDVEEQEGFDFIPRIIELESSFGFTSSWNIVPHRYRIDHGIIDAIRSAGHEIGIHGFNHDGKLYRSEKIFRRRAVAINDALKKYGAVGFRSPLVHRNLRWLQMLDIEYDASCFDYDPFQQFPGGTKSIWPFIAGKFVELPYTLPQDHTLWYALEEKTNKLWETKIDWLHEHRATIHVLTHPDYVRQGNHLARYEALLRYLCGVKSAWHALPRDLARWWRKMMTDVPL